VHHNFVRVDGEKMSKSLNNFFTIDDVLKRNFQPAALRLLFLMTHYRSELNFTWESLAGSQTAYDKLVRVVAQLRGQLTDEELKITSAAAKKYQQDFTQAIENDLDTPVALSIMWKVADDKQLAATEKLALLLDFDQVLSLGLAKISAADLLVKEKVEVKNLPVIVKKLVEQRQQARIDRDWTKADELRGQIEAQGYSVIDQAGKMELFLKS
jgi:cysteinyl-tRNA synthetase